MILAIDTSSASCSAALFDDDGRCIGKRDELIGRGHAERLAPILAELLDGRGAETILVGVGPGSFTGIRVGIAAAHGLAIGWNAKLSGLSSLALLAASSPCPGDVVAAVVGGHGELFVQQFNGALCPTSALLTLAPDTAATMVEAKTVIGSGARALVAARGYGQAIEAWPDSSLALKLAPSLRSLDPAPLYARAPDAKTKCAR